MDKYDVQQKLGDGTYGVVLRATLRRTGEVVAIKRMKQRFRTFEECTRLPEVIALRKLHSCANVIRLREIFRDQSGELSLVFEFMDGDLLGVIRKYKQVGIPHARVRNMCFQALQGLTAIHRLGYFHRDMKPENILIKREGNAEIVKLADLGLAKEVRSRPPFTDYVSTRWYRAPEILLQDRAYNSPVDIWAMGCIIVELFTGRPLFPGTNEQDQLFKIVTILGSPTVQSWPEGVEMARKLGRKFPNAAPTPLATLFPALPALARDLVSQMLQLNPRNRISAAQALLHPFFQGMEPEATPRPQIIPRQSANANTAPSPHTKGPAVDWRDITGGKPTASLDTDSSPNGLPLGMPQPASGARLIDGSTASHYGYATSSASAVKPPLGMSPGAANGVFGNTPNRGAGIAFGAGATTFATSNVDVSRYTLSSPSGAVSSSSAATARRNAYDLPPQSTAVHHHRYDVPQPPMQPTTRNATVDLRDSFEGLFKAAGIDVNEILGRVDMTAATSSTTVAGHARVTASPPTPGIPPPATGASPLPALHQVHHQPGSGIRFGRRSSPVFDVPVPTTTTPEPRDAENINTAAAGGSLPSSLASGTGVKPIGESPLAKLLAQSRYRATAGQQTHGGPLVSAAMNSAQPSSSTTLFKSPSFARKPSPLSVSVLQQHHQLRSSGSTLPSGGSAPGQEPVFDALAAAEAMLGGAGSHQPVGGAHIHRQLFTEEGAAPPCADRPLVHGAATGTTAHQASAGALRPGRTQGGQIR